MSEPIEMRCRVEELPILLNVLGSPIILSYPFYGFPLLTAWVQGDRYRFAIKSSREKIEAARDTFGEISRKEMPEFDDLLSCMINAGIVKYTNWGEFQEWYRSLSAMKKGSLFALDTNLLYHGFPLLSSIDPGRFLLIDIIKQEMENSLNAKFTAQQITEMKRELRYQKQLLDEFWNQRPKRTRLATYLALRQYQGIRDRALSVTAVEPASADKERNDLIVVQTIKKLEGTMYQLPVLITADRNIGSLCIAEGIEHFIFQVPHLVEEEKCTPSEFVKLLFNLAGVFGVIQCNSVYIFGEFRGKGSNLEEMKLIFQNQKLAEVFQRDQMVCRKLQELIIGK